MPIPVLVLAFANAPPSGGRFLRHLVEERRALQAALKAGEVAGRWEVVVLPEATLDDLLGAFQDPRYRDRVAVLHYAGHAESFGLLLETAAGSPRLAGTRGLAAFLGQQRGIECVVLNGCSTLGQVRELTAAGVPAVVATAREVDDAAAASFAARFYQGLAAGATLQRAYVEAGAALEVELGVPPRAWQSADAVARDVVALDPSGGILEDAGWPWALTVRDGSTRAGEWGLGLAGGDPLWGLPPLPAADLPAVPYRHLLPYSAEHAPIFFGRGKDIRKVYDLVARQGGLSVVVVSGQSGAGKSSLLTAGVLPRLRATHLTRYVRRSTAHGLAGGLREALGCARDVAETDRHAAGALADAWRAAESIAGRPLVVVIDQVDEAFTDPGTDNDEVDAFVRDVSGLFRDCDSRPKGRLVLSMRKEWYLDLRARLRAAELPFDAFFLERVDQAGVIEVITGPARDDSLRARYHLTVAPGLAEEMASTLLADAQSPVAPTLQVILATMWERADARAAARGTTEREFDAALYSELRREGLLLEDFVQKQLERMEAALPDATKSGLVLDILAFHTTALGTAATRTRAELDSKYAHARPVLPALLREALTGYLLVDAAVESPEPAEKSKDEPVVPRATRLAHDTLAPLIRRRFEQSFRPGQQARRVLEARAVEWREGNTGRPLAAADLETIESGLLGMRALSDGEQRLLDASRAAREAELAAAAARELADLQAAKARSRAKRLLGGLASAALLTISALGLYSVVQGRLARREAARARAASIEQFAEAVATGGDWVRAALLLATLDSLAPLPSGAIDLARALLEHLPIRVGYVDSSIVSVRWDGRVAVSSDGRGAVSSDGRGAVTSDGQRLISISRRPTLLDGQTGGSLASLESGSDVVRFSPDGRFLLTAAFSDTARIWDVLTGRRLAEIDGYETGIKSAAFSFDGRRIVTGAGGAGLLHFWDVATGKQLDSLTLPDKVGIIDAVALSPDGHRLVTASLEERIARVWDAVSGNAIDSLVGHLGGVTSVAFSHDGRHIVTASTDHTARIWDAATGRQLDSLVGHQAAVRYADFTPDGQVFTHSYDGTFRLWEMQSRWRLRNGHDVLTAAFSPDGRRVVTASRGGVLAFWDAATGRQLDSVRAGRFPISFAFSPDGRRLATAGSADTARVWDASNGHRLANLEYAARHAAFSPDGRRVVTASRFGKVRFWDAATGRLVDSLLADRDALRRVPLTHIDSITDPSSITTAAFSPDGKRIVTTSRNGSARFWDAATGRLLDSLVEPKKGSFAKAAFSPDGRRVVTTSFDGSVVLWDAATAHPLNSLVGRRRPALLILPDFSPDGQRLVTADEEGIARVWDVVSGHQLDSLVWDRSAGTSVAFSPDGRRIVTASRDSIARVWLTDWKDLRAALTVPGACLNISDRIAALGQDSSSAANAYTKCRNAKRTTRTQSSGGIPH